MWSREGARELKSQWLSVWRRPQGHTPADGRGPRAERRRVGVWTGVYPEFTAPPWPLAPLLSAGAVGDPALGPGRGGGRGQARTDRSPGAPPRLGITPGPGTRGGAPRLGGPLGPTRCDCGALGTLPLPAPPTPQLLPTPWLLPGWALADALSWQRPSGHTACEVGGPPCAHGGQSARPGPALGLRLLLPS